MSALTLARPDGLLVGEERGDGPAAILLHAGGERRGVWSDVAEQLQVWGYRSIAWDQRGHGQSNTVDVEHLPCFAADVAAMVSSLDAMPVLVGASLGGLASLLALAEAQLRAQVAGLVLVDVVPDPDPSRVRAFLSTTIGDLASHPIVEDVLSRADTLRAAARVLDIPTLLVRGGHSYITEDDVAAFVNLVPYARVSTIEDAGHLIARDAPNQLADRIADHLAAAEVRRRRIDDLLTRIWRDQPAHPTGSLGEHLQRTADTLEEWNEPDWIIDAGRLHAIHGTDGFTEASNLTDPSLIRSAVGARAERLIELYGRCDREKSYPTFATGEPVIVDRLTGRHERLTEEEVHALVALTVANELDVLTHDPATVAQHGIELATLFASWQPLLTPAARAAVDAWRETVTV